MNELCTCVDRRTVAALQKRVASFENQQLCKKDGVVS